MSQSIFDAPRLISFDGVQFTLYRAVADLSTPCLACDHRILRNEEYTLFSCCGHCCHEHCLRAYLLSQNYLCSNCFADLNQSTNGTVRPPDFDLLTVVLEDGSDLIDNREAIHRTEQAQSIPEDSSTSGHEDESTDTQIGDPQENTSFERSSPPTSLYFTLESDSEEDRPDNDESCAICTDRLHDGVVTELPCGGRHRFHRACIRTWLETRSTCPFCRTNVLEELLADSGFEDEMMGPPDQAECHVCNRDLFIERVSIIPCTSNHLSHKECAQDFIRAHGACPDCYERLPHAIVLEDPPIRLTPLETVLLEGLRHVDVAQWLMFLSQHPAQLEMMPNVRELLILYREADEPLKILSVSGTRSRLAHVALEGLNNLNRHIQVWSAFRWRAAALFDLDSILEDIESDEVIGGLTLNFYRRKIHLHVPDLVNFRESLLELLGEYTVGT